MKKQINLSAIFRLKLLFHKHHEHIGLILQYYCLFSALRALSIVCFLDMHSGHARSSLGAGFYVLCLAARSKNYPDGVGGRLSVTWTNIS